MSGASSRSSAHLSYTRINVVRSTGRSIQDFLEMARCRYVAGRHPYGVLDTPPYGIVQIKIFSRAPNPSS